MTYAWSPSADYLEHSNVARLMRVFGVDSVDALRARSVADIASFWDAVVTDLGIPFYTPYAATLDTSLGLDRPEWFVGGGLNVADACLGRWSRDTPGALAVVHEREDGAVRSLTYADLDDQVARVPWGAKWTGHRQGRRGLQDADVKAVVTADGTVRRGKVAALAPNLDAALAHCPSVRLVLDVANLDMPPPSSPENNDRVTRVRWDDLLAHDPDPVVEPTAASDVLLLAYTSGTTGRPKGAVHTHAGFVTKVTMEVAYGFDLASGRTFCWITDMGWIMGPLSILGTHGCGGTLLLFEGSPDVPDLNRIWKLAERHRVSMLGVSPTLIRALRASPDDRPDADLSAIRTIGSTGEPWDPDTYEWLARDIPGVACR